MENKRDNFMTRLFARKMAEQAVRVEEAPVVDEATVAPVAKTLPTTLLVYTEGQEEMFTSEDKAYFERMLNTLPPLKVGDLNFAPFEAGMLQGGYYVRVFIRNAKDVAQDVSLHELNIYLIDAEGDKVAGGVFQLEDFGFLKFGESRVWTFAWRESEVLKKNADLSAFTIAFA